MPWIRQSKVPVERHVCKPPLIGVVEFEADGRVGDIWRCDEAVRVYPSADGRTYPATDTRANKKLCHRRWIVAKGRRWRRRRWPWPR